MQLSRRTMLAASATLRFASGAAEGASMVSIRLDPQRSLRTLPADYMGLGFEASSVATPGLLSADNHSYVQLVRNLGKQGVIRVGGNVSDFSIYDANGASKSLPKDTVLTAKDLRRLRAFLGAVGWKLIWGLNLGGDHLDNAVEEARAVADIMGERLVALEIGNEPDLFGRAGHRPASYDYAAWHADYRRYKTAIRAVLPRIPFAGPDLAGSADWMEMFARDEGGDIALLTAHHYITGQANPAATLEVMLQEEKKYQPTLAKFQAAAESVRVPYRLCETASFSGGGKAGVSDTFAAALWALDYLFVLASHGCSGVNMETGVNHLGWISHYTPISDDLTGHYGAAPEYYGLLAFAQAARGEQIALACDTVGVKLTAYATRQAHETIVTVINKDMNRDTTVAITGMAPKHAQVLRLTAPSLTAMSGVSLGGVSVGSDGAWSGAKPDPAKLTSGKVQLDVPAGSAALVTLTV
jgi:Glycosyl hydrolase family 79 C-terminal beta domain